MELDKVNVNGGAIALGHPIGATGAILTTKLIHELQRRKARYGFVTLCIGGGTRDYNYYRELSVF